MFNQVAWCTMSWSALICTLAISLCIPQHWKRGKAMLRLVSIGSLSWAEQSTDLVLAGHSPGVTTQRHLRF